MCNGHPLRRYGEKRPIGASYPAMTHNVSFILLKRTLVCRLPFASVCRPSSVPNSEDFLAPTVITGNGDADSVTDLLRLEHGFMKIYVRKRITQDGGGSVMAG